MLSAPSSGLDTPLSVADSVGSEESESENHRRRYLSCPARLGSRAGSLKRRSAPPIWEIAERFNSSEAIPHDERSLSERVLDHEMRHGSPAPSMHDSWPRVRKQRSDENGRSMTLWQLSNAMAEAGTCRGSADGSTGPPADAQGTSYEASRPADEYPKQQPLGAYKSLLHAPSTRHPDYVKQEFPQSHGQMAPGDSPFDNAFVDAVLGIDKMHVADAYGRQPPSSALPDGSEINLALMQLEALAAEARAEGPIEVLSSDDFDPAELLAILDSPGAESVLALSPLRSHFMHGACPSEGPTAHRGFGSAPPCDLRNEHLAHVGHGPADLQARAYPSHYEDARVAPRHVGGGSPALHGVLRGSSGSGHGTGYRHLAPERAPAHHSPPHLAPCEPFAYVPPLRANDSMGSSGSPAVHRPRSYSGSSGGLASGCYSPGHDAYPQTIPVPISYQTSCASDYAEYLPAEHMRHMASLPTATVVPMGGGAIPNIIPNNMPGNMAVMGSMGHADMDTSMIPRGCSTSPVEAARSLSGRSCPRNALERREWTADEDQTIRDGVKQFGYRWRRIAAQLQGRSDDAVRNRWSRLRNGDDAPLPFAGGFGSVGRNSGPEMATGVTGDGGGRAEGVPARRRSSTPAFAGDEYNGSKPERVGWTQVRLHRPTPVCHAGHPLSHDQEALQPPPSLTSSRKPHHASSLSAAHRLLHFLSPFR